MANAFKARMMGGALGLIAIVLGRSLGRNPCPG